MSSNLLINESPLQVLPSLAIAVGLNEAIILQQMHYWLKVKENDPAKYADSFIDGRCWVYNTVEEWRVQFPFWSTDTIHRAITSLRKQGVLIVAKLAEDSRDRTNWYTIDYDVLNNLAVPVFEERQSKAAKRGKALPQVADMAKTQNAAVHQSKMRQCLTETSSEITQKNTQRVAAAAAPDLSLTLSPEQKEPDKKEPDLLGKVKAVKEGWDALSFSARLPYLTRATEELERIHAGTGITPRAKLVEVRAKTAWEAEQKGGEANA